MFWTYTTCDIHEISTPSQWIMIFMSSSANVNEYHQHLEYFHLSILGLLSFSACISKWFYIKWLQLQLLWFSCCSMVADWWAWWLIGIMADSYDSEKLRGFADWQTYKWTFAILELLLSMGYGGRLASWMNGMTADRYDGWSSWWYIGMIDGW